MNKGLITNGAEIMAPIHAEPNSDTNVLISEQTSEISLEELEAPPGFEPGMEVLQTGPKSLSC